MTPRILVLTACAALSVACGVSADAPPPIDIDRTACSHCGMLVSEARYAAAYRGPEAEARVFDDIGCLLDAVRNEPQADALRFWFHDAADGAWIAGGDAVFVRSSALRTPMGGGMIAFRDRTAARAAAGRHQGTVVNSLSDLLRSRGEHHAPGRDR